MGRSKAGTRRSARIHPQGVLSVYADGYGFVRTSEGDFFIPEKKMFGAFDGDLVEISPLPSRGQEEGQQDDAQVRVSAQNTPAARVVRVIDRAHESIIGRYEIAEPFGVVVPLDFRIKHDIFTMRRDNPTIPDGALVRVRMVNYPTRSNAATGVIEEVLDEGAAQVFAIDAMIERHGLETAFSEGTLAQAAAATLDEDEALRSGYRDLRDRIVVTVDPSDAKDFDDAVSLEPAGGEVAKGRVGAGGASIAWRLGVHIADVAHYVPWDSSIDLDARRRATSVYLVDRVIPMLPEALSNELCSLKPQVVRRSMTVDLYLDAQGEVVSTDIYPALIRSSKRMTYDEVQDILDAREQREEAADLAFGAKCSSIEDRLWALHGIAELRRQRRKRRGAPEFDNPEAKVVLDENREPVEIVLHEKTPATELIEEAMLMANEAVAHFLVEHEIPGIFRVHEAPSPLSIAELVPVFEGFPWFEEINEAQFVQGDSFQVQKVLELSKGRAEEALVSSLTLRAMKRASYSPTCQGHYGLSSDEYLHFTSPIRRYPDLVVHRMLKAYLEKKRLGALSPAASKAVSKETTQLAWISEHSSTMERLAEQVSRESHEYMMVEYLQRFVGQRFSATISGVANYGLYVQLDNTAEGLLPLRDLGDDYFMLDATHHVLVGEQSGATFRLGQRLVVVLSSADSKTRTLSFKLFNKR